MSKIDSIVDQLIETLSQIEKEPTQWNLVQKTKFIYGIRKALQLALNIKKEIEGEGNE